VKRNRFAFSRFGSLVQSMAGALLDHVFQALERHRLADRPGVIAISGGPDSVALAHLCASLWRNRRLGPITLAHLNHQLRGADSDADEAFVQQLPAAWNFPALGCRTHRLDIAGLARERGDNLETTARDERYRWLAEVAQQTGAAWIATGHTADDQAETILHHFLRGSGLQGLAGMAECRSLNVQVALVRPLLTIHRRDVLTYLEENHLCFRQDATNLDLAFTRNRLRHELLPLLERDYNAALVRVLGRTAAQFREVQAELTKQAASLLHAVELPRVQAMIVLKREPLLKASVVVLRELLRLLWQREGWPQGEMGYEDWNRAAGLLQGAPGGHDFPGGVQVCLRERVIQLFPKRRIDSCDISTA
jgi:tRNA(Ile)-lysidine synthase